MNDQKIKGMLWGTIIGDALGITLDGLTSAHIHSIFRKIEDYTDPAPALKGKPEHWRKPGLYSTHSQLMLLLSMFAQTKKNINWPDFVQLIAESLGIAGNEYGIFRHPSVMERHLINNAKTINTSLKNTVFSYPCADNAVILIPLTLNPFFNSNIERMISSSLIFNSDVHSCAGALLMNGLLKNILEGNLSFKTAELLDNAIMTADLLLKKLQESTAIIFKLGLNPDYLLSSISDYLNIISKLLNINDNNSAGKLIVDFVNKKIKTSITRATVNHPLAIIPFSIYLTYSYSHNPSEALFRAAENGGSSPILCALVGALIGAMFGLDDLPENLINDLVNKRRIINIISSISGKQAATELIHDFILGEASLTAKEIEEKNAKLKHVKIKTKKQKTRHEIEKELSTHIVESWTKLERAKWRRKLGREQNNE